MLKLDINDTYAIIEDLANGKFYATRNGEAWRNLVGDNLVLAMAYKIEELEKALERRLQQSND